MTKQKAYVQFSKRIVLLVTIAVTAISLLAMVLCFFRSDTEALVSTVRTYINYATIVFAAYSGNSVFEKWLTQGKSVDAAGDTEELPRTARGAFSYRPIEKNVRKMSAQKRKEMYEQQRKTSRIDSVSASAETETPVYALGNSRWNYPRNGAVDCFQ